MSSISIRKESDDPREKVFKNEELLKHIIEKEKDKDVVSYGVTNEHNYKALQTEINNRRKDNELFRRISNKLFGEYYKVINKEIRNKKRLIEAYVTLFNLYTDTIFFHSEENRQKCHECQDKMHKLIEEFKTLKKEIDKTFLVKILNRPEFYDMYDDNFEYYDNPINEEEREQDGFKQDDELHKYRGKLESIEHRLKWLQEHDITPFLIHSRTLKESMDDTLKKISDIRY